MIPPASWRPHSGQLIVGPAICQGCGTLVWFGRAHTRRDGQTVRGEVRCWREWGLYRVHSHAPVKGLRRTLKPRVPKEPGRYPQLANARAEWDNRAAGSSSQSNRLPTDARDSATTREAGVAAPIEVVAR